MSVLKKANAYLIQVDSTRKNYVPSQVLNSKESPIFAEDILLHNRFTLNQQTAKNNTEFNNIKKGDYLVVYCNSLVPHSPNQIKFIFTVINRFDNIITLKIHTKLNRGYPLDHIYSLVDEGKLSPKMRNCGKTGFKLCQIPFDDVELLINFDPIVRTYHSTSWKI